MIYPWHTTQWQYILDCKRKHRLPHALLLTGLPGLGKLAFAKAVAELMLCRKATDTACGTCSACNLLQANNHPDLVLVQPTTKNIKVEQMRQMLSDLAQTSQQGGYQVFIIEPADTMNVAAANALLKTLEEPAKNILILLVTSKPSLLPATIKSRCQQLPFYPPSLAEAKQWLSSQVTSVDDWVLEYTANAPLLALEMLQNVSYTEQQAFWENLQQLVMRTITCVTFGENLVNYELDFVITNFFYVVLDVLKLKLQTSVWHQDKLPWLQRLANKIEFFALFTFLDELLQLNKHRNSNLNKQLAIEMLAIKFIAL